MKMSLSQSSLDYQRIEQAIHFLEENAHKQPELSQVASAAHLSEYHFQRLFSRWVGLSPKRFLQFVTKEHAKSLLRESHTLLDVTFETGLSSPGRLHDLFVQCEAVTPGEYKKMGESLTIEYGFHPTPFGQCLLATTGRGICGLEFVRNANPAGELQEMKRRWSNAAFRENAQNTGEIIAAIFNPARGSRDVPFHVYLKGTNFQIKVWEALLRIPYAKVVSYDDIARQVGRPNAVRAVANAIGRNPVPFLIPCHRVIRKLGEFGGYASGSARKKAILGWEMAKSESSPALIG